MIRDVMPEDIPVLKKLARSFFEESRFGRMMEYDAKTVDFIIDAAASDVPDYLLFIADVGEGIAAGERHISGALLATVYQSRFSTTYVAMDDGYRSFVPGKGVGAALVTAYRRHCQENSIIAQLAVNAGIDNEAGYSLMEKTGFREIGRTFMAVED